MDWKEKKNKLSRVSNPAAGLPLMVESPGPLAVVQCSSTDVGKIYESQEQVIKASFGHQPVS